MEDFAFCTTSDRKLDESLGINTALASGGTVFNTMLKGDSRLASSHLEIYVSLFQPVTFLGTTVFNTTATIQPLE